MYQDPRLGRQIKRYGNRADDGTASKQGWVDDRFDPRLVELTKLGPAKNEPGHELTWIVPLPVQDMVDTSRWAPGVVDDGSGRPVPGEWLSPCPVYYFGELKRHSIIPYNPAYYSPDDPADMEEVRQLPIYHFRDVIWRAAWKSDRQPEPARPDLAYLLHRPKDGESLNSVDGRVIYGEFLPRPDTCYLVRALIVARGDLVFSPLKGLAPGDRVPLFALTLSTSLQVRAALRDSPRAADGEVPSEEDAFTIVDPVGEQPMILCIYRDGLQPHTAKQVPEKGTKKNLAKRFLRMPSTWKEPLARDPAALRAEIVKMFPQLVPFHNVLRVCGIEEQVRKIAEAFPPAVVRFGLDGRPEWLRLAEDFYARRLYVHGGGDAAPGDAAPGGEAPGAPHASSGAAPRPPWAPPAFPAAPAASPFPAAPAASPFPAAPDAPGPAALSQEDIARVMSEQRAFFDKALADHRNAMPEGGR